MLLSNGEWYRTELGGYVQCVGLYVRTEENEHRSNEYKNFTHRTAHESAEKPRKNDWGEKSSLNNILKRLAKNVTFSFSIAGDVREIWLRFNVHCHSSRAHTLCSRFNLWSGHRFRWRSHTHLSSLWGIHTATFDTATWYCRAWHNTQSHQGMTHPFWWIGWMHRN